MTTREACDQLARELDLLIELSPITNRKGVVETVIEISCPMRKDEYRDPNVTAGSGIRSLLTALDQEGLSHSAVSYEPRDPGEMRELIFECFADQNWMSLDDSVFDDKGEFIRQPDKPIWEVVHLWLSKVVKNADGTLQLPDLQN